MEDVGGEALPLPTPHDLPGPSGSSYGSNGTQQQQRWQFDNAVSGSNAESSYQIAEVS